MFIVFCVVICGETIWKNSEMKKAVTNTGSEDQIAQTNVPKRVQFAEVNQATTSKPSDNPEAEKDKYREILDQTIKEHLNDSKENNRMRNIMATSKIIELRTKRLQLNSQIKQLMSLNTEITKQNVLIRKELISKNDMIEMLKKSTSCNTGALKMVSNHQNVLVDGINALDNNRVAMVNDFDQMKRKCTDTVTEYRKKLSKFENEESQKDDLIVELRNQLISDKEKFTEELNAKDQIISDINKKLSVLSNERRDEESIREELDKVRQNYAVDKEEWTKQIKTLTDNLQNLQEKYVQAESALDAMTTSRDEEASQIKTTRQRLNQAMLYISNRKDEVLKKENSELQQKIESLQNELKRQKEINDSSNMNNTFNLQEDENDPFVVQASSDRSLDSELSFDQSYRAPVYKSLNYNVSQNKPGQTSVRPLFGSNHPDVFRKRNSNAATVDSTSNTTEAEGPSPKKSK